MAIEGEYEPSASEWVRNQVEEYESSGGTRGTELDGYRVVVITSVGAKSGKVRKNPVMRVERDGTYVAIASKGGAEENPEWYHNYLAHPEVELQDREVKKTYRAEVVHGAEREDLWQLAVDSWPTYASYQEKTDREIPVFKLVPLDG